MEGRRLTLLEVFRQSLIDFMSEAWEPLADGKGRISEVGGQELPWRWIDSEEGWRVYEGLGEALTEEGNKSS